MSWARFLRRWSIGHAIGIKYPNNRRHISDRRSWNLAQFPLIDSDGTLIIADRRQQADRRLSSILVEDSTHDL